MKEKENSWFARLGHSKLTMPIVALALLLLFNLFFTPGFFSIKVNSGHLFGTLIDIIKNGAPLIMVSMGMTLVMATAGCDISVGSVAGLTAVIIVQLYSGTFSFAAGNVGQNSGIPLLPAVLIGFFVALLCGAFNGYLVAKRNVEPFIATLIMQAAARGLAYIVTDGRVVNAHGTEFQFFGGGYFLMVPFSMYIAIITVILVCVFARKTPFGLYLEAIGSNKTTSYFSGIKVGWIIWISYVLTALLAGGAGFLLSSNINAADPNLTGMYLELDAILACVLGGNSMKGGKFSLFGTFIGALIVRTLTVTIYARGIPADSILLFKALVVILVGVIQNVEFKKKRTILVQAD